MGGEGEGAAVEFPLRGEWTALQTPAAGVPSHGTDYFAQRYAFDFVRLHPDMDTPYRPRDFWRHLFAALPPEAFLCWDAPVHAAFDGVVARAGDGWPDGRRINLAASLLGGFFSSPAPRGDDYRPLTGNFVIVEGAPGAALYAHLRDGSVRVRPGDAVRAGDVLGTVGHSGNSTMPHLHFHLMDGPDPLRAAPLPCAFRAFDRLRDGVWQPVRNGIPGKLERIRGTGTEG